MLTYTGALTLFQKIIGNSETGASTFFSNVYDLHLKRIYRLKPWSFLKGSQSITTIASQQFYDLKHDFKTLESAYLTIGTNRYVTTRIADPQLWNQLNESTSQTSDYPIYHYIKYDGSIYQIGFFPIIASASNTFTINYIKRIKKNNTADYTTGTITLTNGDATVTGSGTTFTAAMVGRWLQSTDDKEWYRIASFTNTTSIELEHAFQGTTAAGASYKIGEVSELPEDYQELPVYMAISDWFAKERKYDLAKLYRMDADAGIAAMEKDFILDEDPALDFNDNKIINPNLYITQ